MGDVRLLVKRLAIGSQAPQVESKALEYLRRANAMLGRNALGQAEVCKAAVCVDLACTTLQVPLDSSTMARCSGVGKASYTNARATLQKALGVRASVSHRDLCIQFGCARYEAEVQAAFATYKQRFLAIIPESQRSGIDFTRPVFLAAVFTLIARKHRVRVARERLLPSLGITPSEFNKTIATVTELIPEMVVTSESQGKRKAGAVDEAATAAIEIAPEAGESGGNSEEDKREDRDTDSEEVDEPCSNNDIKKKGQRKEGGRPGNGREQRSKKAKRKTGGVVKKKNAPRLSERKLRQAVLGFAEGDNKAVVQ